MLLSNLHGKVKLLLLCVVVVLVACQQVKPKVDAYDSYGHPVRVADYQGKWVLVNYWAAWCVPCLRELPELERFYRAHRDNVVVLGVSFDQWSDKKINQLGKKLRLTFPLLSRFPARRYGLDRVPTVPVTLVISPEGKFYTVLHGPQERHSLLQVLGLK